MDTPCKASNLTVPEDEFDFQEASKPYTNLGPNYFASQTIAERFFQHFEEKHFTPLIEKFTEKFRDELWTDLSSWLLSDTQSNLACEIRNRVDASIDALLGGNPHYIKQYVLGEYGDNQIREAIAQHIPKELQDARVVDL